MSVQSLGWRLDAVEPAARCKEPTGSEQSTATPLTGEIEVHGHKWAGTRVAPVLSLEAEVRRFERPSVPTANADAAGPVRSL